MLTPLWYYTTYTLDETTGTTISDSSSNVNNGRINESGSDRSVAGVSNIAFDSNASGYISTPDGGLNISGDAPRTISFWFNAAAVVTQ
jgi:hypothetical protein